MSRVLKMPRMGETMDEGKLLAWLVKPGQPFKRGDAILEVETDKTIVEYPALGDGTLVESLVEIGEMVEVGMPIAKIDVGEGLDWIDSDSDSENSRKEVAAELDQAALEKVTVSDVDTAPEDAATMVKPHGEKLRATPLARRIAKQTNIDLAGVVGTGRRGRIERRDVETASQVTESGYLQTGHGIAWSEKGVGSGAHVLFIHGFAADHSAWSGLQSQLARSGLRTVAVDLPSHGAATQDARDISELVQPVITLVEEKMDGQAVHIVAHSMGALVAVALSQAVPTASVTLIAPAGVGRTINTHFINALVNPHDVASVARVLTRLTHGPNGLSDTAHEAIFHMLAKGRIAGIANSLAGASGQAVDVRKELAQIAQEIPVSLLLGHRDQIIDWSEAVDVSPLVSVHHFPDAGHMPHWEALSQVQAILERKVSK
ncbi:MAG: alpha/beta fold hydrolase [Granulosicoccus sp.]